MSATVCSVKFSVELGAARTTSEKFEAMNKIKAVPIALVAVWKKPDILPPSVQENFLSAMRS
jgi:hypothetical protein